MNMKTGKTRTPKIVSGISALLAVAAGIVVLAVRVRAEPDQGPVSLQFVVHGIQANSSAPFILQGDVIGSGATWQHLVGPLLNHNTVALIPGVPETFGGVGCQAEYSQDQIVTRDGSTMTFNVYGLRCKPYNTPDAHTTIGAYSVAGGTGRFKDVTSGTGTVTIDGRADGSATLNIGGFLVRTCTGGACGS
jgi:hypothetical protein